jgi:hypothetical protein
MAAALAVPASDTISTLTTAPATGCGGCSTQSASAAPTWAPIDTPSASASQGGRRHCGSRLSRATLTKA